MALFTIPAPKIGTKFFSDKGKRVPYTLTGLADGKVHAQYENGTVLHGSWLIADWEKMTKLTVGPELLALMTTTAAAAPVAPVVKPPTKTAAKAAAKKTAKVQAEAAFETANAQNAKPAAPAAYASSVRPPAPVPAVKGVDSQVLGPVAPPAPPAYDKFAVNDLFADRYLGRNLDNVPLYRYTDDDQVERRFYIDDNGDTHAEPAGTDRSKLVFWLLDSEEGTRTVPAAIKEIAAASNGHIVIATVPVYDQCVTRCAADPERYAMATPATTLPPGATVETHGGIEFVFAPPVTPTPYAKWKDRELADRLAAIDTDTQTQAAALDLDPTTYAARYAKELHVEQTALRAEQALRSAASAPIPPAKAVAPAQGTTLAAMLGFDNPAPAPVTNERISRKWAAEFFGYNEQGRCIYVNKYGARYLRDDKGKQYSEGGTTVIHHRIGRCEFTPHLPRPYKFLTHAEVLAATTKEVTPAQFMAQIPNPPPGLTLETSDGVDVIAIDLDAAPTDQAISKNWTKEYIGHNTAGCALYQGKVLDNRYLFDKDGNRIMENGLPRLDCWRTRAELAPPEPEPDEPEPEPDEPTPAPEPEPEPADPVSDGETLCAQKSDLVGAWINQTAKLATGKHEDERAVIEADLTHLLLANKAVSDQLSALGIKWTGEQTSANVGETTLKCEIINVKMERAATKAAAVATATAAVAAVAAQFTPAELATLRTDAFGNAGWEQQYSDFFLAELDKGETILWASPPAGLPTIHSWQKEDGEVIQVYGGYFATRSATFDADWETGGHMSRQDRVSYTRVNIRKGTMPTWYSTETVRQTLRDLKVQAAHFDALAAAMPAVVVAEPIAVVEQPAAVVAEQPEPAFVPQSVSLSILSDPTLRQKLTAVQKELAALNYAIETCRDCADMGDPKPLLKCRAEIAAGYTTEKAIKAEQERRRTPPAVIEQPIDLGATMRAADPGATTLTVKMLDALANADAFGHPLNTAPTTAPLPVGCGDQLTTAGANLLTEPVSKPVAANYDPGKVDLFFGLAPVADYKPSHYAFLGSTCAQFTPPLKSIDFTIGQMLEQLRFNLKATNPMAMSIRSAIGAAGGQGIIAYYSSSDPLSHSESRFNPATSLIHSSAFISWRVNIPGFFRAHVAYEVGADTYTVRMWRALDPSKTGRIGELVAEQDDVYCDMLDEVVDRQYIEACNKYADHSIDLDSPVWVPKMNTDLPTLSTRPTARRRH